MRWRGSGSNPDSGRIPDAAKRCKRRPRGCNSILPSARNVQVLRGRRSSLWPGHSTGEIRNLCHRQGRVRASRLFLLLRQKPLVCMPKQLRCQSGAGKASADDGDIELLGASFEAVLHAESPAAERRVNNPIKSIKILDICKRFLHVAFFSGGTNPDFVGPAIVSSGESLKV